MGVMRKYDSDQFKEEAMKLAESVGINRVAKDIHTTSGDGNYNPIRGFPHPP